MNEFVFIITMLLIIYSVTVIVLLNQLNKKDKMFNEERKDLLNRLMAKNTTEYINIKRQEKPTTVTDGDILGDDYYNGIIN